MKRLITFLLCVVGFFSTNLKIFAQEPLLRGLCFTDGYGYEYVFPSLEKSGNTYTGTGTSSAYGSSVANITLSFNSKSTGTIFMSVVNSNPDGCTNSSDSYEYTGIFTLSKSGGRPTGSGQGSWVNYCFGAQSGSGTWVATGPCGSLKNVKPGGFTPTSGKNKIKVVSEKIISITPNPVVNFTKINYMVSSYEKVNITIYNYMQQPVRILINQMQAAGTYSVNWNTLNSFGNNVPNGIYQVVASFGNKVYTSSLQVIR